MEAPQASNKLCCSQRDSPNLYTLPTGFSAVKTESTILYKIHTRFEVDRTNSPNLYELPTGFLLHLKQTLQTFTSFPHALKPKQTPNHYKPATRFPVVKKDYTNLIKPSYTLCGRQNGHAEAPKACNKLLLQSKRTPRTSTSFRQALR